MLACINLPVEPCAITPSPIDLFFRFIGLPKHESALKMNNFCCLSKKVSFLLQAASKQVGLPQNRSVHSSNISLFVHCQLRLALLLSHMFNLHLTLTYLIILGA